MVICLERGADLHMAQLMPLSLTVSCFSKIQICFTFLVPAHLGSPGQRAVTQVVSSLMEACELQQQLHGDGLHQQHCVCKIFCKSGPRYLPFVSV